MAAALTAATRTPLVPGYPALRIRAARLAALFVALIALTVLAGWASEVAALRAAIPGAVEMKANTALALLLCAIALGLLTTEPAALRERAALALAVAVALLGVATLSEYVFGWDLHIDEALFRDTGSAFNDARGRMSPYSAVAFAGTGLALAVLPRPELRPLLWIGTALTGTIGALSAIGYAWNVNEIVTDRVLPPVAINTAIALMLVAGGILVTCSAWDARTGFARATRLASLEVKVLIGFVAAVALLLAAGAFTYRSSQSFTEALERVADAQTVRAVLGRLESNVSKAELAQRTFLLTQRTDQLVVYGAAVAEAVQTQQALTKQVEPKPEQRRQAAALAEAIAQRIRLFDGQIIGSGTRDLDSLRDLIASPHASSDAIHAALAALDANEAAVLEVSRTGAARVRKLTFASLLLTLCVAAGLMTFLFRGIRREVQVRHEVERFDQTRHDVLRVFATCSTREEALAHALGEVAALEPFLRASLYVHDVAGRSLVLEATRGAGDEPPFVIAAADEPVWLAAPACGGRDASQPIYYRDRLLGLLHLSARAPLTDRERDFVGRLADELALALSHLEQFVELHALSTQLAAKNSTLSRQAEAIEQASRMKSEFLATMSHELRTPLNAIIGFAEVLRDDLAGELTPQQREYVGDIEDSGEHLLALINDILDLSKVEAGKMDLVLEPIDVAPLLENSLSMVKGKALARALRVTAEIEPNLGLMQGDARKVKQIVYNLLANAVKFTPDGGSIVLGARSIARNGVRELEITVTDTGIGIAANDQARLFHAFVQIDSSLQKQHQGTGLGLAMVKRLAELHGGDVTLVSAPGEGSKFTVRLPRLMELPPVVSDTRTPPSPALPSNRPLALVVEDDDRGATVIRLQLEHAGFAVVRAGDAATALALARERLPAVITLDVLLPGTNGWDLLVTMKADPALAAIPVLVVSIVADQRDALALGASGVLQKPMDRADLRAALAAIGLVKSSARKVTALVVDDDPSAVEILAAFLSSAGCRVLRADGGRQAIEMARQHLPDVLLLDLMTPEVSGFDVLDALKGDPRTARIPIIVVTAKLLTSPERLALDGQVSRVLYKGEFRREKLLAEVRRAVTSGGE